MRSRKLKLPMTPLSETASALAQEIHERANNMLALKMENVEVQVAAKFDAIVDRVILSTLGAREDFGRLELGNGPLKRQIASAVMSRLEQRADEIVEKLVPRVGEIPEGALKEMIHDALREFHGKVHEVLRSRTSSLVVPVAERIVAAAMAEIKKYYAASTLLSSASPAAASEETP